MSERFSNLSPEHAGLLKIHGATVLEPPELDEAIVEVKSNGAVVYSKALLIDVFMEMNSSSYEEAVEHVEYNTIRALPYMPEPRPEVIDPDYESILEDGG